MSPVNTVTLPQISDNWHGGLRIQILNDIDGFSFKIYDSRPGPNIWSKPFPSATAALSAARARIDSWDEE